MYNRMIISRTFFIIQWDEFPRLHYETNSRNGFGNQHTCDKFETRVSRHYGLKYALVYPVCPFWSKAVPFIRQGNGQEPVMACAISGGVNSGGASNSQGNQQRSKGSKQAAISGGVRGIGAKGAGRLAGLDQVLVLRLHSVVRAQAQGQTFDKRF